MSHDPFENRITELEQQLDLFMAEVDRRLTTLEESVRALHERVDSSMGDAVAEVRKAARVRKQGRQRSSAPPRVEPGEEPTS